jgi:RNA polymerase sigma-70 factor (sigma-E family)
MVEANDGSTGVGSPSESASVAHAWPSEAGAPELVDLYVDRYASMVRLAHLITGSAAVAPDLVQEAFIKVAPRLDRLDSPGAYLRTTVVNECRSWLRRQGLERRHQRPQEEALAIPPEVDEMWSALAHVAERQRAALVLRFYEDLPYEEIAEALGCRLGTAKSLVHRGLAALREVLER